MAHSKKFSIYLTTWLFVLYCSCTCILGQQSIFSEHSTSRTIQTAGRIIPQGQYTGRRVNVGPLSSGHIGRPGTIIDRSGFHGTSDKIHTSTLVQHVHPTRDQHILSTSNIPAGVVFNHPIDNVGVHGNHGNTATVHTHTVVQPETHVHLPGGQPVISSSNIPGGVVIDRHIDEIGVHGNHGPTARVHTRTLVQPETHVHLPGGQPVIPSGNIPGGVVIDRHIDEVGVHGNHGPTARVHTRTLVQPGTLVHRTRGQPVLLSNSVPGGVVIDRHIDEVGIHGNHGPTARVHTRTLVQPGTVVHPKRDSLITSGHLHTHGVDGEHSSRTKVIEQHVDPPFTDGNNSPVPAVHTTVVEKTHGTDPVHDHHHDILPEIGRRGRRRFGRRGRGWRRGRGRGRGWRRGRRRDQIQVETGGLAGLLGGLLNAAFRRINLG